MHQFPDFDHFIYAHYCDYKKCSHLGSLGERYTIYAFLNFSKPNIISKHKVNQKNLPKL